MGWAKHVTDLHVDHHACSIPGLVPFVREASQLHTITCGCSDLLACSQADTMLAGCQKLHTLVCEGLYVPHQLPHTLCVLHVDLEAWLEVIYAAEGPERLLDSLLYRASLLPSLQHVELELGQLPLLSASPSTLMHRLGLVKLSCRVHDSMPLDLSWLLEQPIGCLELHIILSEPLADLERLLLQLRPLSIHSLSLQLVDFTPEIQRQWAGLQGLTSFSVRVLHSDGLDLTALPPCMHRSVSVAGTSGTTACLQVDWAVLIGCPGKVMLNCTKIKFHNCPGVMPAFRQPWQLRFRSAPDFEGLNAFAPFIRRRLMYTLQTNAADAAGW